MSHLDTGGGFDADTHAFVLGGQAADGIIECRGDRGAAEPGKDNMLDDQRAAVIETFFDLVDEQAANALALGFGDNDAAAFRLGGGPA